MMKRDKKRILVTLLIVASMFVTLLPLGFQPMVAEAATQNEAVSWATSQIGKGLDCDSVYGNHI